MTTVLVALMALGLAAVVGYPLWKGVKEDALSVSAAELVVQDGVAYVSPDELALDHTLGRVGGKAEAVAVASVDFEQELERRVSALRHQRRAVPAAVAATVSQPAAIAAGDCPQCGHSYDAGDRFCARCGASLSQACPNCGHSYDVSDLFCSKCGQRLAEG